MQVDPSMRGNSNTSVEESLPFKKHRKPGPIGSSGTRVTTVVIEEESLDWAKEQPGGLSGTLRRLLREEIERTTRAQRSAAAPGELSHPG